MEFKFEGGVRRAIIKVVGVGGCGSMAVENMIESGLEGVEYIVADIDCQALSASQAKKQIQLGGQKRLIKSSEVGDNQEIGRSVALENASQISEHLVGADLVFVVAGMGGETGTGAVSVVAQLAQEAGALVVGLVTKPFDFEGKKRMLVADGGLSQLMENVDALITVPNQRLLCSAPDDTTMDQAFKMVDDIMLYAVQGISGLINGHEIITGGIDFQDIKTIMQNAGMTLIGVGIARGENRYVDAVQQAISSLQMEHQCLWGGRGVIVAVSLGNEVTLSETDAALKLIDVEIHKEAEFIWGMVSDDSLGESVRVTVILTDFDSDLANQSSEVDVTIEDIIQTVSDYYEISTEDLLLYDKNKNTLLPRQIAMYLSRSITGESYPEIGSKFRGRPHASIMYACKKVEEKIALDNAFSVTVENLKKIIKRGKFILDDTMFWQQLLDEIQNEVGDENFKLFFKEIELVKRTPNSILIGFPNNFTKKWIDNNYASIFTQIGSLINGTPLVVKTLISKKKCQSPCPIRDN